ncbi:MAG: hypothetical protein JW776_09365 [Candidatus Lokiarchaeota archaeon]|nr:hypothetical protein [Candidatus Lokiarchaeota archaeon]
MEGIHGKILVVDLSSSITNDEMIDESIYRQYYGGYGLGVYYIYKNIVPCCDPLGPDNILGVLPGLLTGSPAPLTGRFIVCGKSPLTGKGSRKNGKYSTGGWGNSNSGGMFGPSLRKTGYDGIFFHGISKHPVYLLLNQGVASIESAKEIWGKDCVQTEEILKKKHGKSCEIASIGQAGENLSLVSGIVTDGGRIAARSGLGAVMGSKKLKAICACGNTQLNYADKKSAFALAKEYNKKIQSYTSNKMINGFFPMLDRISPMLRLLKSGLGGSGESFAKITTATFGGSKLGTTVANVLSVQTGDAPVKNFKGIGYKDFPFKKAMKLRGKRFKKLTKRKYGCFGCPVQCGAILEYENLPYEKKTTHRPEYETSASFGCMILCDDFDALMKINEFLNRVGMDSISAGNIVAFVMEAVENGILKQSDFKCTEYPDGFLPTWGAAQWVIPLLKLIVTREGIGDTLADGTMVASQKIPNTSEFVMHCNGQELPMHDPRFDPSVGLTYIIDPTPGRHTAASMNTEAGMGLSYFVDGLEFEDSKIPEEQAAYFANVVKFHQTYETLGLCMFSTNFGLYPYLQMMKAVFDWEVKPEELLKTGHRIQTLRQMFNAREGAIRHELSQRAIGNPPLTKGPTKGVTLDLEKLAFIYYKAMGYTEDGLPLETTLKELNLDFCVKDLAIAEGNSNRLKNEWIEEGNEVNFGFRYKKKG